MAAVTLAAHLPDALQDLPWLVTIPIAMALIAGLLLWLAGRRLLRPFMILTGLGVGGLIGFLLLPVIMPGLALSPYLGMIAGAASGLTTALLLYQVATAVTFGSAIGAGCGIAAAALLGTALTLPASAQVDPEDTPGQLGGGEQPVYVPQPVWTPAIEPLPEPDAGPEGADVENPGVIRAKPVVTKPKPTVPQKVTKPAGGTAGKTQKDRTKPVTEPRNTQAATGGAGRAATPTVEAARETAEGAAAKVTVFWGAARAAWSEWWESVPSKNRPWIIGATVGGVTIGTVLGLLLPAWSAGAVTALAGSAIWLPAALWLGTAWGVPGFAGKGSVSLSSLSTGGWIAVWLVVASIGVACQWYGLMPAGKGKKGKGKKKSKPKADDDE
ncbi:MAG: hypothetical protein QM783_03780 [Phycisphaerales bacterium]